MKKITFFLILTLHISFLFGQTINDSTCWEYFKITKRLKENKPLSKTVWNELLSNNAIRDYLNDQGADSLFTENYRKAMEIVYMPKYEKVLKKRLKNKDKYPWTLIINKYKIHEDEMKRYLINLQNDPHAYLTTAYKYSYEMLPKKYHRTLPDLKIVIIPIHYDAHAGNGMIDPTLIAAYFYDLNKKGVLLGHEFHHYLRPRLEFEPGKEDQVIIKVLRKILNEGSADLIDKRYEGENATKLLKFERGYPEAFLSEGPKVLKHIDSILSSDILDKSKLTIKMLLNTWNTSGHIPGYYMANIIEKNGYKKNLIAHIEDPFYFVYLYNQAAKKDKHAYVISNKAINLIKKLDNKYRKNAKIYLYGR